jgi:hypothetical protein
MKALFAALWALITIRQISPVGPIQLANQAAPDVTLIGLANEVTAAKEGETITHVLIPYGNHDHAQGLQVFDKGSGVEMANEFNSLAAKATRLLFGGLPVYVGHPDHPSFANEYKDKRAVGWLKEVKALEEGLDLGIAFTKRGTELIANEEFKFISPNWWAKPVAGRSKQYRPSRLKSIGLTNDPEIPVGPLMLANEAGGGETDAATQLANEKTARETAETALANEKTARETAETALANERTALATERTALANEKTARQTAETALANERGIRAGMLIAAAIVGKRVTPADEAKWKEKFTADFAAAETALANEKAVASLPSGPAKTAKLGTRHETSNAATKLTELANERAEKTGEDFTTAWLRVKADPANAALLEAMKTPAK